jgi:hypothetical protein
VTTVQTQNDRTTTEGWKRIPKRMESRSSRLLAADEELVLCEAGCGVRRTHRCFVLAYSPLEFRDTLHMIAEGKIDCAPIVTGTVGLDGVDNAFTALKDPEKHAKTLIDPSSTATAPKG